MCRILFLSVIMLTIFFIGVSIAQLSNASKDKTNIDTCDPITAQPISANPISANPISAVGHGAIVNAKGKEIDVIPEFILEAQRYYLKSLFHQANEKQRSKFRKKQKQLLKGNGCDRQNPINPNSGPKGKNLNQQDLVHANFALIAWLIGRVKPENASGLASINTFLLEEFAAFPPGQGANDAKSIPSKRMLEIFKQEGMLLSPSATNNSGTAYINECRTAGVPIPPDWGSSQWQSKGILANEFISKDLKAEVFTFESSSPRGICFALPRICTAVSASPRFRSCTDADIGKIMLLGIICQGSDTNKACFWDNQRNDSGFTIPQNSPVPLADFAGGAELYGGDGGVCSNCHAGENPFIVHPGTPLDQGALLKPKNWHEPLVHPNWPQNPGPTNLLDGIELGSGDNSCIVCHSQPAFGRFPEVSTELRGYCNAVLQTAIRKTMPPGRPGDASYRKHVNALTAACGRSKGLLASDNSILRANSPAESFTPCFEDGPCPKKKTVTFMLEETTEVFITYDLGQSHGCCADHMVGVLKIFLDGTEIRSDRIEYVNYGVPPFFLEDFDYFFPPEVVEGFDLPVSQLDSTLVGPLLQNYKIENRRSLGNLTAGSHTVEMHLGDAGWNSIFEILQ